MTDVEIEMELQQPPLESRSSAVLPGWWWWVTVRLFLITGVIVLYIGYQANFRPIQAGAILLLAMGLSHPLLYFSLRGFAKLSRLNDTSEDYYGPALIGFVEAIAYPTAFLIDKPDFIGAWLAIKVAGGWQGWATQAEGRKRFNKFLFGNGSMILIGFVTSHAIKYFVLS